MRAGIKENLKKMMIINKLDVNKSNGMVRRRFHEMTQT